MRLLHVIDTTKNSEGGLNNYSSLLLISHAFVLAICALSPSSDPSFLAYPSPVPSPTSPLSTAGQTRPAQTTAASLSGDVLLFDTRTLSVVNVIQAHKSPLAHIAINSTGTLLATASDKGTVIRIFTIPSAEKLYQFRRGTREAKIYSISFNAVSTLLAVSSATDTVHIFRLIGQKAGDNSGARPAPSSPGSVDSQDNRSQGGLEGGYEAYIDGKKGGGVSYVKLILAVASTRSNLPLRSSLRRKSLGLTKGLAGSMGGYLPNTLTEMWEPSRDFAHLKLPTSGSRCIVALSG